MECAALHVSPTLAGRLEGLCAAEVERFVTTARELDPASKASTLRIAGGVAAWVERGMSVNQAFGLGFSEPVTPDHIAAIERFYAKRNQVAVMGVCPLAGPSLTSSLAARRWVTLGFENVLVLSLGTPLPGGSVTPGTRGLTITEANTAAEKELWANLAAIGFSAPDEPTSEQSELARIVVNRAGTRLFVAWIDGKAAGTGELFITGETAWLSGDATLAQFRGMGVQQALQRHRLGLAQAAGATLAVSEADPGSTSQRNMERLGFHVAYTRVQMAAPPA